MVRTVRLAKRVINVTPHVTQNEAVTATGKAPPERHRRSHTRHQGYDMSRSVLKFDL